MRLSKTVDLGEGRTAVVHEMQVQFVRNLLINIKGELAELQIEELLGERFTELISLSSELIELPGNESIDNLAFSELKAIWEAFKEVNAAFFDLTGLVTGLISNMNALQPISTKAAASSSNADMPASAATAGAST